MTKSDGEIERDLTGLADQAHQDASTSFRRFSSSPFDVQGSRLEMFLCLVVGLSIVMKERTSIWRVLPNVVLTALKDFVHDNALHWAAAVAFYALFSAFPLLLLAISLAAQVVDTEWAVKQATDWFGKYLPTGTDAVREAVVEAHEKGGTVSIISLLALLWTGSYVFGGITTALNIAYDVDEIYSFGQRLLVQYAMMLSVGVLFVVALVSPMILRWVSGQAEWLPLAWVAPLIPVALLFCAFLLTYRWVPRRKVHWRSAAFGSAIGSALFLIAKPIFVYYVERLTDYNLVYGSLALVVVLVFWAWIGAAILLLGGEFCSHFEMMLVEQQTAQETEERHLDRAPQKSRRPVK